MSAKWKMINTKQFTGEYHGYEIVLKVTKFAPIWHIYKDGVNVDSCFYHSPTKCELTAKVQCERVIDNLIKNI